MAGAGDEEWIYVLSQQEEAAAEDAEAEQAVTADVTAAAEENNKPSKNPDDAGETAAAADEEEEEEEDASAHPSEPDNKAAAQPPSQQDGGGAQSSLDDEEEEEYPDCYTPEQIELETKYWATMAAFGRASKSRHAEYRAYLAAYRAYLAAFDRAAKTGDGDAAASGDTAGRLEDPVMENPYYDDRYNSNHDDDTYAAEPAYPYSGPASLGLGSGYDDGFPGAYGPATGSSGYVYGGYGGYYDYGEPYAYLYVPEHRTAVYQEPATVSSGSFYPLYVYPPPAPAPYVPSVRPDFSRYYPAPADEPSSPPAVAPTTQPPELASWE